MDGIFGLLALVVYVVTVALSPVLAIAVVLLARQRSPTAALGTVVGVLAALVTLSTTVVAALFSLWAAVAVFLLGFGALLGLVVVPLFLGRTVVRRATGVDREDALRLSVMAWPLALAGSFALFVAPGGASRYNITFLSGAAAVAAWLAWALVVLVGPGLVGAGLARLFGRFR